MAVASLLYLGLAAADGAGRALPAAAAVAHDADLRARPPWARSGWARSSRTVLVLDAKTWAVLILAYCFVASLVPVWALLQPRGYLGGFVLYMALAVGVIGIFFGGFPIQQPAFTGFRAARRDRALFPFLFVTIACGACSGFHGLVCSGTTSKQIARETHCKPIGYGAMLLEGFVALIALGTIMIARPPRLAGKAPGAIYGAGPGPLPHRDHRREAPGLRHHLRRHGVLHLRLRHPRRHHPPRPLHPAGAASAGAAGSARWRPRR